MSGPCLQALPAELIDLILSHLSISCLLTFSQTNKRNQALTVNALYRLDLAVLPKPIHSMLAFIEASCRTENAEEDRMGNNTHDTSVSRRRTYCTDRQRMVGSSLSQIGLTTQPSVSHSSSRPRLGSRTSSYNKTHRHRSRSPSQQPSALSLRTEEINNQNQIAQRVLSTSALANIRSLTLHLYNLASPELASIIATSFPHLQHLNLNFTHAYINDYTLPSRYWRDTPGPGDGTTAWNTFSNISITNPSQKPILSTLRSLTLRRASITSTQLRKWIEHNPCLTSLSLENVRGVDVEFCDWLAEHITHHKPSTSSQIERINLEDCAHLRMKTTQESNWVDHLSQSGNIDILSLEGCNGVDEDVFKRVVLRSNPHEDDSDDIEMDESTSSIRKVISPKGAVFIWGRVNVTRHTGGNTNVDVNSNMIRDASMDLDPATGTNQNQTTRGGPISPALSIKDEMMGNGYWKEGEMEVDPDL